MNIFPRDVQNIVFDFVGCISIRRHRIARFVTAEIDIFRTISQHWSRQFSPSFVANLGGYRNVLKLAYSQAHRKAC